VDLSTVATLARVIHLQPTAPLADRVMLPGDPGRALRLAQALLNQPKMFNHNRGLWGYTGTAHDGAMLTIQSSGMGGPSAAIVVHELIELGARRLLRVGTCGALDPELSLGQLLIATEAMAADGTSRALGAGERVRPAPRLLEALDRAAGPEVARGPIVSTDLFYDERGPEQAWRDAGLRAVEMESATLLRVAERHQRYAVEAATLLVVSDVLSGSRERIDAEALEHAEAAMGGLAAEALSG
jgi:uridine phosphorylase